MIYLFQFNHPQEKVRKLQKKIRTEIEYRKDFQNKADENFKMAQKIENRAIIAETKATHAEKVVEELKQKLANINRMPTLPRLK